MQFKVERIDNAMDINEEYERIFGVKKRPNLYTPDDVDYLSLRREILCSPKENYSKDNLPFEGIHIPSYNELLHIQSKHFAKIAAMIESIGDAVDKSILHESSHKVADLAGKIMANAQRIHRNDILLEGHHPKVSISSQTEVKAVDVKKQDVHYFYIKRTNDSTRSCNAKGVYNSITNKFTIKAGSQFSLEMAIRYRYSEAGILRQKFLDKKCLKSATCYILRQDEVFDSPSGAAAMVLGRPANGWNEWKDDNSYTLDAVYRNDIYI